MSLPSTSLINVHNSDDEFDKFIYGIMQQSRVTREEEEDDEDDDDNNNKIAEYNCLVEGFFDQTLVPEYDNMEPMYPNLDLECQPTSADSLLMRVRCVISPCLYFSPNTIVKLL
ncbi:hypothetical protein BDZ94DRAFT_1275453, partial [Collybia nuda]